MLGLRSEPRLDERREASSDLEPEQRQIVRVYNVAVGNLILDIANTRFRLYEVRSHVVPVNQPETRVTQLLISARRFALVSYSMSAYNDESSCLSSADI